MCMDLHIATGQDVCENGETVAMDHPSIVWQPVVSCGDLKTLYWATLQDIAGSVPA